MDECVVSIQKAIIYDRDHDDLDAMNDAYEQT